jgi:glycerol kinase
MEVMKKESGFSINSIGVDGGASVNNYLLQFQADILDCKIRRAGCLETTALGAAYMAGLVVGIWNSLDEIRKLNDTNQIFMRRMPLVESKRKYEGWKKAVAATRLFK